MTHRCRDYKGRPVLSVRKSTVMEGTKMRYRTWAIDLYIYTTNITGTSSMRLHRELSITQKIIWFMLHRLREAADQMGMVVSGMEQRRLKYKDLVS